MTTSLTDPKTNPGSPSRAPGLPTKHQMALMICLAVFPTLTVLNLALGDWLRPLNPILRTFVLATIAVPIISYALMPQLHRLRRNLLTRTGAADPSPDPPLRSSHLQALGRTRRTHHSEQMKTLPKSAPHRGTITPTGPAPGAGESSGRAPRQPRTVRYRRFRRRENNPPPRTLMRHTAPRSSSHYTSHTVTHQQYGGRCPVTVRGRQGPAPHHHDDSRRPAVDGGKETVCVCPRGSGRSVNPATGAIRRLVDTHD